MTPEFLVLISDSPELARPNLDAITHQFRTPSYEYLRGFKRTLPNLVHRSYTF